MLNLPWLNDRQKRKILEAIQNGTPEGDMPDVSPVHELPQNRDPGFTPRQDPIIPNNDVGFTRPQATSIAPALSAPASYNPRVGAPFESPTLAERPPELLGSNPAKVDSQTRPRWFAPQTVATRPDDSYATGDETRKREVNPPSELDRSLSYINELRNAPLEKKGHWWTRLFKGLGRGFMHGGVPGALTEGVASAVDSSYLPRQDRQQAEAREWQRVGNQLEVDKTKATIANQQSLTQTRADKEKRQALKDAQGKVFRNLSLLKGQKLDPNNPNHAQLLQEAQNAGVFIDPDTWNNAKGNLITFTRLDPDNDNQTQKVTYNTATGETSVLAQAGYVQPVDAKTGMTAAQTGTAKAREEAARARGRTQAETARHNRAMEGQGQTRIAQGQTRITQSETKQKQAQELHVNKDIAALRDMHAELSSAVDKDAAIEKIITQEEYMSSLYPDDERVKKAVQHSQMLRSSSTFSAGEGASMGQQ